MRQKNFLQQILIAAIAVMVIAYMVLQLTLSVGEIIDVRTVELAQYEDTCEATGYIFRNEKIISSTTEGSVSFLVEENCKVAAGTNVIAIYSNPADAELQEQINQLKNKIAVLEKSSETTVTTNPVIIEDTIQSYILEAMLKINYNDVTGALYNEDDLLVTMNRKDALKSTVSFEIQKQTLNNEVTRLENSMRGSRTMLYADKAGYFYSNVDGYESVFTMSALENLTLQNFDTLISSEPNLITLNAAVGKIVYDSTWYFVCKLDKRTASNLIEGNEYTFEYLHTNDLRIEMTFERAIIQTDSDDAVVVFYSQEMPDDFSFSREQPVKIILNTYEGLEVPTSAIRRKDGKSGVYTLKGNIVKFKEVEILYERKGSFIVELPDKTNKSYVSSEKLSLYDTIIVGGKDIYDGKVLK